MMMMIMIMITTAGIDLRVANFTFIAAMHNLQELNHIPGGEKSRVGKW